MSENVVKPMKKCSGECGVEKEENTENFYWNNIRKKWKAKCRICSRKKETDFRKNNPELVKAKDKIKNDKNKEKAKEYNKKYYADNKEEISLKNKEKYNPEYHREYYLKNKDRINERKKNRLKNDPIYKIQKRLSEGIRTSLKGNKNGSTTFEILPYTEVEFKKHIEKHFNIPGNEWMTWSNWNTYSRKIWNNEDKSTWVWNLDHIKPVSHFDIQEAGDAEFLACWDLSNLRPYSAKQNILDGNRR